MIDYLVFEIFIITHFVIKHFELIITNVKLVLDTIPAIKSFIFLHVNFTLPTLANVT